jgi:hypothetical protein
MIVASLAKNKTSAKTEKVPRQMLTEVKKADKKILKFDTADSADTTQSPDWLQLSRSSGVDHIFKIFLA